MEEAAAPDGYPSTGRRLSALHVAVRAHGPRIVAAGLFVGVTWRQDLPIDTLGASGAVPNASWDEALVRLGCPRVGRWCHYAPEGLWLAEVVNDQSAGEGARVVPTRPWVRYIVLTTQLPDSGLVFGTVDAVSAAARTRVREGRGAPGALVAAYVRMFDALVRVDVETDRLVAGEGSAVRYRVRTWLDRQLLGQDEFAV